MYILSLTRLYNFIYFVLDILLDELEEDYAEQMFYIIRLYNILM